jgi:TATA-box binding protein (TBP) (component of TFIID and TFIIIB)
MHFDSDLSNMKRNSLKDDEIKIANVVATVTLTAPLNLALIHERIPQTEFPGKSPWLKLRLQQDNTYTALQIQKVSHHDKKSLKIAEVAQQVLELLQDAGIKVEIIKTEIHNFVL